MKKEIELHFNTTSIPNVVMKIEVPNDRDVEEYIDEFLDTILTEDLQYVVDWNFV